jgi:hypothetical protein
MTKIAIWLVAFLTVYLVVGAGQTQSAAYEENFSPPDNQINGVIPSRTIPLPSGICPGGDSYCHYSSPVLYDLTDNGRLEIIVATNNGYVLAFQFDGTNLTEIWRRDVAPYFNMSPGSQIVSASPAIGDIDNNGHPEIVIATGTARHDVCAHGGILVLDRFGQLKGSQWPRLADDHSSNGCRDGFFSTPALGDLTGDGRLEIVVGGFDKRLYAWRHDGTTLPGFPANGALADRFPTWPNFMGRLADTIWGSPALADLTGDGFLDIIIGTDEGNFDARYGGNSGGWQCPYTLPSGWAAGYCGGTIYAFNRFGEILPGFPKRILEAVQSTPVVADVTGDGHPEIFIGTGSFYHNNSPDRPTYGSRVFGWNRQGQPLQGWTHTVTLPHDIPDGKVTNGSMPSSPSLGDITGDGQANIVSLGLDGWLYAWHINGQPVAGFPMTPLTQNGTASSFDVGSTAILADYTGDGRMEIIFNQAWSVTVVNGSGVQLTAKTFPSPLPLYLTTGSLLNNPAVGDLDGDGKLELVAFNSQLHVWKLPASAGVESHWPMFKRDAERTSAVRSARLVANPHSFVIMHQQGQAGSASAYLNLRNSGELPLDWTLNLSGASGVAASKTSGSLNARQTDIITITIQNANRPKGHHEIGTITLNSSSNDPISMPILLVVGDISHIHLPTITR